MSFTANVFLCDFKEIKDKKTLEKKPMNKARDLNESDQNSLCS